MKSTTTSDHLFLMIVKITEYTWDHVTVAVLGKNMGPGPSSFGGQPRLNEITIEPIKNLGGLGKIWGAEPLAPAQHRTAAAM